MFLRPRELTVKNETKYIRPLVFTFSPLYLAFWCFLLCFFMGFSRFQILISEPQSIWRKLLVLSWLYNWVCQSVSGLEKSWMILHFEEKFVKLWILVFPPKQLGHQNWEASVVSPKVLWEVARFFSSVYHLMGGKIQIFTIFSWKCNTFLNLRHLYVFNMVKIRKMNMM